MSSIERFNARVLPAANDATRTKLGVASLLMFASGAAGLVWQMVWTAQLGVALGHEIIAVLSVMAAFFGGLAAGAFLLANRLEHTLRPGRWYAFLEALIGGWALLVSLASPPTSLLLSRWIGAQPSASWHWAIAFFIPFVALLPATLAMGATLPAMERLLRGRDQQPLGTIYAANTAGATVGLLMAVFVFIPGVGLLRTTLLFASVNVVCALVAWVVWGREEADNFSAEVKQAGASAPGPLPAIHATFNRVAARLFFSGLLGVGYEVLAVRVLAQVTENTVYTYALILANFLAGTAFGAAVSQRFLRDPDGSAHRIDRISALLLMSVLLGGLSLWWADYTYALPVRWLGPGVGAALLGELISGAAAVMLPSMAMGALFTSLCRQASQARLPLGFAFAINTVGCAFAPILVGLWLLPHVGAKLVLILLACGYLAMRSLKSWNQPFGWIAAAVIGGAVIFLTPLRFIDVPDGGRILSYHEGVMAAVSVVEDADGIARLHINNRVQEGSSASGVVETRLAQLPLLLHTAPKSALFLGYGTGYTANAAALDPRMHVKAVELLPEVIDAAGLFALKAGAPSAARPVTVIAADARRYVQATPERYDVIVSDLFHPARNGAGSLYTVEHFAAVKLKLEPGGLFCQWLALHQMDLGTLQSIVAAYLHVYPNAVAILASNSLDTPVVGLIARPDDPVWNIDVVRARLSSTPPIPMAALKQANIEDAFAVMGSIVADSAALRAFAGAASVNTDDHPVVAHRAPWVTYSAAEPPRDRLAKLLHAVRPRAENILRDSRTADAARLSAYWQARSEYLAVGMTVKPHPDPHVMLERLHDPLLRIVAISPDFRPASAPLLALSRAVRSSDPNLSAQVEADLRRTLSPSTISNNY